MPLYVPTPSPAFLATRSLSTGETALDRTIATNNVAATSSTTLLLTYFTAMRTEVITQVMVAAGSTAAAATPTLVRYGVWTAGVDGALLAQVGATANDTTLLAATNTAYPKALSASFTKTAGTRYACGILVVSGAAMPTYIGGPGANNLAVSGFTTQPVIGALANTQNDLPSTLAAGSIAATSRLVQFSLLQ